jgi:hypothetical protein
MVSKAKSPGKKVTLQARRIGAEIVPKFTGLGWLEIDPLKAVPFRWDLLPYFRFRVGGRNR